MVAIRIINDNTAHLESVTVTTPPTKTSYYVGETFDPSGMILTGIYRRNDNSAFTKVLSNYSFNPNSIPVIEVGAAAVEITVYDNNDSFTLSFPITVSIDTFANCSWDVIQEVSQAGLASTAFNIGDVKTTTINDTTYNITIIGFDHDNVSIPGVYGRTKAGLTLQIGTTLAGSAPEFYLPFYASEGIAWNTQTMRNTELANLWNLLDVDLGNVIVPVTKSYDNGTTIDVITDGLFLLSVEEYLGTTTETRSGQGTQYAYFADKSWTGGGVYQLTRSIRTDGTTGGVGLTGMTETKFTVEQGKIKPAFCI